MIYITANKNGPSNSVSRQANYKSDTQITLKFNGIDQDEITDLTYQLGDLPASQVVKTIGSGIDLVDDYYVVSLDQADLNIKGLHKHYLQVTDATGTYTATLNIGRLNVQ